MNTNGVRKVEACLYLDTVVRQLVAGRQHLDLFLFHSSLFKGICMRIQKLGNARMLCRNRLIEGCPSSRVSVEGGEASIQQRSNRRLVLH